MDPIYHIKANRRKTFLLFFFFIPLFLAVGYAIGMYIGDPLFGVLAAVFVTIFIFLATYSSGHNLLTSMAGARPVARTEEPYLYHTLEGLSIAAGIPVPQGYIIETEAPNAFAAGSKPGHSVVAVTRGLLNKLDRLELEGVLAHEISHIKNYDILVATMAVVLAGTIVFAGEVAARSMRYSTHTRRGGRNSSKGQGLLMLIVIVLAVLAPIFARILQFAISREREYLADASAAELTGYPEGLASALEKISGLQRPGQGIDNRALQGLYIVNPALRIDRSSQIFASHPPTDKRIARLRQM
jgi:heat shock protein HtpX